MRLRDKVGIITGGGTGIGSACARLFCQEGAKVAIFGRREDKLGKVAGTVGENMLPVPGDITVEADLDRLVSRTLEAWGRIDILVNNAGTYAPASLLDLDAQQWDGTLNVNLRGVFRLSQRVLRHMAARQSGSIVHVSSVLGMVAAPGASAYNVSKGALNQFSRSIAVEFGGRGIRSNAVCPGLIATDMTAGLMADKPLMEEWIKNYPIGRFGVPEDVARCCLFLAGDESSFITGAVIPVDGGYTAL